MALRCGLMLVSTNPGLPLGFEPFQAIRVHEPKLRGEPPQSVPDALEFVGGNLLVSQGIEEISDITLLPRDHIEPQLLDVLEAQAVYAEGVEAGVPQEVKVLLLDLVALHRPHMGDVLCIGKEDADDSLRPSLSKMEFQLPLGSGHLSFSAVFR